MDWARPPSLIKKNGQKWSKWSKMVKKMVKNGQKSEYFLIMIFWIGQAPPPPLTERKKAFLLVQPFIFWRCSRRLNLSYFFLSKFWAG